MEMLIGKGKSSSLVSRLLFSHDSQVRNLNLNSKCAFWIIIRMTVFWTVCTTNHIAIRNLKCAINSNDGRTVIWIAHFKLRIAMWFGGALHMHGPKYRHFESSFWRIAHFKLKLKLHTLLSCENSPSCLMFTQLSPDIKHANTRLI